MCRGFHSRVIHQRSLGTSIFLEEMEARIPSWSIKQTVIKVRGINPEISGGTYGKENSGIFFCLDGGRQTRRRKTW